MGLVQIPFAVALDLFQSPWAKEFLTDVYVPGSAVTVSFVEYVRERFNGVYDIHTGYFVFPDEETVTYLLLKYG